MPQLWIAQFLCPSRHTIFGIAYDLEETPKDDAEKMIEAVMVLGGINRWCGLCESRELRIEHSKLAINDWDAATVVLRILEQRNIALRAYFDKLKGNTN